MKIQAQLNKMLFVLHYYHLRNHYPEQFDLKHSRIKEVIKQLKIARTDEKTKEWQRPENKNSSFFESNI